VLQPADVAAILSHSRRARIFSWDRKRNTREKVVCADTVSLNFHYPPAFDYKDYLRPQIKIGFGRGDQQPSEKAVVTSFVAEEFPMEFTDKTAEVIVLDCQRTFREKVTLLRAENHRPDPSKLKPRMSRHWSDIAVMSVSDRFVNEKLSPALLRTVIRFNQIYFAANWAKFENAVPEPSVSSRINNCGKSCAMTMCK